MPDSSVATEEHQWQPYRLGAGDVLDVFVWRNPDVSVTAVPVRPDGRLTIPLVENIEALGKTPEELARAIEKELYSYIRAPRVTVTVKDFVGELSQQVRVVGGAVQPASLPYREGMRVVDLIIMVGGLSEFAAGNKSVILRQGVEIPVYLEDILSDGDFESNITMLPGDTLVIPLAWF